MSIKQKASKLKTDLLNFNKGLFAYKTGTQLKKSHLNWFRQHEMTRNASFREKGFNLFQLISPEEWQRFSSEVQAYFETQGKTAESKVDWAINKRVYLDIERTPSIKKIIDDIMRSDNFRENIKSILGKDDWKLFSVQIWRNFPEKFDNKEKEVNSSFYHVDNGGEKENRALVNIFMYLTPVTEKNGPFTFFDKPMSHRINKEFVRSIMKYGNLRQYHLTQAIESKYKPNLLLESGGSAIAINNQECLHRAGFCTEGHRDIIEFIVSSN